MWFITVFTRCEFDDKGHWPVYGAMRTWGYYSEHETALQALHENWTDMWETCYHYAVLEYLEEGIAPYSENTQWFKYDRERDGYFEIETPKGHNCWGNFALG